MSTQPAGCEGFTTAKSFSEIPALALSTPPLFPELSLPGQVILGTPCASVGPGAPAERPQTAELSPAPARRPLLGCGLQLR